MCPKLKWEQPIFLNLTAPINLQTSQRLVQFDDPQQFAAENSASVRRKLESQKGGVRSNVILIFNNTLLSFSR